VSFIASIDTNALADRLLAVPVGEVIPYAELSAEVGLDVRSGGGKSRLRSARHRLQREKSAVFGTVAGVGLRRLNDEQIVEAGSGYVDRVRRTARRGAKLVTAVADFGALPQHAKARHNAQLSVFAAIEAVSASRTVNRLAAGETSARPLPIAATLEAFRGLVGARQDPGA
jgi:hypothetical protein